MEKSLKGLIESFLPNIDIGKFDDRIKVQKLFYLMNSLDITKNNYDWHIRGPYSVGLTKKYFSTYRLNEDIKVEIKHENLLAHLKEFISYKQINTVRDYEILASVLYISDHSNIPLENENELIEEMGVKKPDFKSNEVQTAIILAKELKKIKDN